MPHHGPAHRNPDGPATGLSKTLFEGLLHALADQVGAGRDRCAVLVLDNAGWHTAPGLAVPDGLRLVYLPPYSPEQPAKCFWQAVDEPVVNKHFDTLAEIQAVVTKPRRVERLSRHRR